MSSLSWQPRIEGCPFINPRDCPFYNSGDVEHRHGILHLKGHRDTAEQDLHKQIEELQKENEELRKNVQRVSMQIVEVERNNAQLRDEIAKRSAMEREVSALKASNDSLNNTVSYYLDKEARKRNDRSSDAYASKESLKSQLDAALARERALDAKLKQFDAERAEASQADARVRQLEKEKAELKRTLEIERREIDQETQRLKDVESNLQTMRRQLEEWEASMRSRVGDPVASSDEISRRTYEYVMQRELLERAIAEFELQKKWSRHPVAVPPPAYYNSYAPVPASSYSLERDEATRSYHDSDFSVFHNITITFGDLMQLRGSFLGAIKGSKDGSMDRESLRKWVGLHGMSNVTEEELTAMIVEIDVNQNGKVDWWEFFAYYIYRIYDLKEENLPLYDFLLFCCQTYHPKHIFPTPLLDRGIQKPRFVPVPPAAQYANGRRAQSATQRFPVIEAGPTSYVRNII